MGLPCKEIRQRGVPYNEIRRRGRAAVLVSPQGRQSQPLAQPLQALLSTPAAAAGLPGSSKVAAQGSPRQRAKREDFARARPNVPGKDRQHEVSAFLAALPCSVGFPTLLRNGAVLSLRSAHHELCGDDSRTGKEASGARAEAERRQSWPEEAALLPPSPLNTLHQI